jgi:hypothetical protein
MSMFVIRAKIKVDGQEYLVEKDEDEPHTQVFKGDEDKAIIKVAEVRSLIGVEDIRRLIEMTLNEPTDTDQ